MTQSEFSRLYRLDTLGGGPRAVTIEATAEERAALAERFGLLAIDRLSAEATLRREGERVLVEGRVRGAGAQACVATGAPVPAVVDEALLLRFVPAATAAPEGDEIELDSDALDEIGYEGGAVDLGEAAAQGFALALDPFPRAPGAEAALREAGILTEEEAEAARQAASPFAMLKGLGKS
ncbi:YceD family protein [Sphingomonas morindae]|uniref:DUF177 domain-containing protein n=1 Tax=Sphingomonas morindae TaxID=1541170 RepID=A0ABY4X926_9SPHN|nr:YceD family protein [Sphingomonas morindae]USI73369.1 DUF177 domain-containing protein [Sphingomonas morindae]